MLIVALGTALAVPVGLVPVWAMLAASGSVRPYPLPWRPLLLLALAVPVAGALTRVVSGLAQRHRPVRLSTRSSSDCDRLVSQ